MMKIINLTLGTTRLDKISHFYSQTLGVPIVKSNGNQVCLVVGDTQLTFQESPNTAYYHFAINIPSYQIKEALSWIKARTNILPFHGNEIVDFKNWNAEALYFYDPAGNIVEFIARKNLKIPSTQDFNSSSFQHISEVGLPVSDVKAALDLLNKQCNLRKFSGDFEKFCAIGGETGLFITIDYNQKDWIPNGDKAYPFPFTCVVENDGKRFGVIYEDEQIIITQ
ncbi:VOC family protein [Ekhidna sp.]|uniref:VOC family protein n=1 Tax=Ekhidna sp. TaxID=2608089 RepID=UPI003C7C839F